MQNRLSGFGATVGEALHGFWHQDAIEMPFIRTLFALFLCTDVALILIHLLYMAAVIKTRLYSIQNDQGYAEFYQAIKEGWLSLIFVWYAVQSRNWRYFAWAAIFFYILFDDFLMIHERLGELLAASFHLQGELGLRGQDLGELLVLGGAGVILIPILMLAFHFGDPAFRHDSVAFMGGCLLYAAFALGVDMLHVPFLNTPLSGLFGLLEDGGELLIFSFLLWMGLLLLPRRGLAVNSR